MNLARAISVAKNVFHIAFQPVRNYLAVRKTTKPGSIFFNLELQQFLRRDHEWLTETAAEYRAHFAAWKFLSGYHSASGRTDGFAKSMDVAEGFVVWALVKYLRPRTVVELGTQYGISARLWKEALKAYVPEHELILCDLEDMKRFIKNDECTFLKGDAKRTLETVFAHQSVDVLFNDAHPYSLISWSVQEGIQEKVKAFLFHDVGRQLRGPFRLECASLSQEEKLSHNTDLAACGHWERHVMAEVFGERLLYEDTVEAASYRGRIFDSLFGLGVVLWNKESDE
jgi:hypothetical protein